jgi:hypothetical protein
MDVEPAPTQSDVFVPFAGGSEPPLPDAEPKLAGEVELTHWLSSGGLDVSGLAVCLARAAGGGLAQLRLLTDDEVNSAIAPLGLRGITLRTAARPGTRAPAAAARDCDRAAVARGREQVRCRLRS